jgi:hypothetical protein
MPFMGLPVMKLCMYHPIALHIQKTDAHHAASRSQIAGMHVLRAMRRKLMHHSDYSAIVTLRFEGPNQ